MGLSAVCARSWSIAVIVLYYRSAFSLLYLFFPTLLGVAMAFGLTGLTIGYLNTNTAFLGSIILGNGINFGIIMLARFREERTLVSGVSAEQALTVAIARTARPTLAAALCAGIAYGSLALTRFRGFRQFGEIGGIGMALCWLTTYSYAPALICFVERILGRPTLAKTLPVASISRLAEWMLARRKQLLAVVAGLTVISLAALAPIVRNPFEYDFSKLRNQHSRQHGVGDLYVRVGAIFPQDLAPVGVALMPSADDAVDYRNTLLAKDCADGMMRAHDPRDPKALAAECTRRVAAGEPTGGLLMSVATAHDLLPKDQDAKLAVLGEIRSRLHDPSMDLLTVDERSDTLRLSAASRSAQIDLGRSPRAGGPAIRGGGRNRRPGGHDLSGSGLGQLGRTQPDSAVRRDQECPTPARPRGLGRRSLVAVRGDAACDRGRRSHRHRGGVPRGRDNGHLAVSQRSEHRAGAGVTHCRGHLDGRGRSGARHQAELPQLRRLTSHARNRRRLRGQPVCPARSREPRALRPRPR